VALGASSFKFKHKTLSPSAGKDADARKQSNEILNFLKHGVTSKAVQTAGTSIPHEGDEDAADDESLAIARVVGETARRYKCSGDCPSLKAEPTSNAEDDRLQDTEEAVKAAENADTKINAEKLAKDAQNEVDLEEQAEENAEEAQSIAAAALDKAKADLVAAQKNPKSATDPHFLDGMRKKVQDAEDKLSDKEEDLAEATLKKADGEKEAEKAHAAAKAAEKDFLSQLGHGARGKNGGGTGGKVGAGSSDGGGAGGKTSAGNSNGGGAGGKDGAGYSNGGGAGGKTSEGNSNGGGAGGKTSAGNSTGGGAGGKNGAGNSNGGIHGGDGSGGASGKNGNRKGGGGGGLENSNSKGAGGKNSAGGSGGGDGNSNGGNGRGSDSSSRGPGSKKGQDGGTSSGINGLGGAGNGLGGGDKKAGLRLDVNAPHGLAGIVLVPSPAPSPSSLPDLSNGASPHPKSDEGGSSGKKKKGKGGLGALGALASAAAKKKGGGLKIEPVKGAASNLAMGEDPGGECKAPEGDKLFDPAALAVRNAFKALEYAWTDHPGFCKFVDPPNNEKKCTLPLKAPCCAACGGDDEKIKCVHECFENILEGNVEKLKKVEMSLDEDDYSLLETKDVSEIEKQVRMAYCGFACMSCKWRNVGEGANAGADFEKMDTKKELKADGDATHPPGWWLGIMHDYLVNTRSALEAREPAEKQDSSM
jgi:chemotaxis protein histidine kinase CheA